MLNIFNVAYIVRNCRKMPDSNVFKCGKNIETEKKVKSTLYVCTAGIKRAAFFLLVEWKNEIDA